MNGRRIVSVFAIVISLFVGGIVLRSAPAFADGIMIPPVEFPVGDAFSIKYHRVTVEIEDGVCKTSVDQVFVNLTGQTIEANYVFPIPRGAALEDFAMYVGEQRVTGQVLGAGEARKIYEDIVRQQRDPALLEYIGNDAFKARVYPIGPNEEKRVQLSYTQALTADNGVYEYVYPLNTEKFSAQMISEVTLTGKMRTSIPLKTVYSPSHQISLTRPDDNSARFSFEERDVRPNIDFVLYYSVDQKEVGANLMAYDADDSDDGFFLATVAPKVSSDTSKIVNKNFIFVLDRSGSMEEGDRIVQAKQALKFVLNNLNDGDRFNVIAYADSCEQCFKSGLKTYGTSTRDEAQDFVRQFDADGSTNINEALLLAADLLKKEGGSKPSYIVFLTDGLPTAGVTTDEMEILANFAKANTIKARTFTFGVGYDVNTHLLDKLAEENKGVTEYVRPNEDIEAKVSSLYGKISNPVLTDVRLTISGVEVRDVYPKEMPDLFKGSQVAIAGRFTPGATRGTIEVAGTVDGKPKIFTYPVSFASKSSYNFIPRLWASRKIGYLNDEIRLHGQKEELINEIIKLSKRYGIITEWTSFLIREDDIFYAEEAEMREAFDLAAAPTADLKSGAGAVGQAQQNQQLKGNAPGGAQGGVNAPQAYYDNEGNQVQVDNIKFSGDRTFFMVDDYWTDSRFDPEKQTVTEVKAFTEAYFNLLATVPVAGQYFSLGDQVIIVLDDDEALKISTEQGEESMPQSQIDTIGKQIASATQTSGSGNGGTSSGSGGGSSTNGVKVASNGTGGGYGRMLVTVAWVALAAYLGYRMLSGKPC